MNKGFRHSELMANVANGEVFKKSAVKWHCSNCGYVFEGSEVPRECPACKHAQSRDELLAGNF